MKIFLSILLHVSFYSAFSQIDKTILFTPGVAFRNAAIRLEDKMFLRVPDGYRFNSLEHFRTTSFSIDISRNIWSRHWYVQLSNYIRYGHVAVEQTRQNVDIKEIKRLKRDHLLDLLYKFNLNHKKVNFVVGGGIGFMNFNSTFNYDRNTGNKDANGNWIYVRTTGGFRFFAPRIIVGIERKNLKDNHRSLNAFVIAHGTPDEDYEPYPTIWLEGKVSYTFHLKSREK